MKHHRVPVLRPLKPWVILLYPIAMALLFVVSTLLHSSQSLGVMAIASFLGVAQAITIAYQLTALFQRYRRLRRIAKIPQLEYEVFDKPADEARIREANEKYDALRRTFDANWAKTHPADALMPHLRPSPFNRMGDVAQPPVTEDDYRYSGRGSGAQPGYPLIAKDNDGYPERNDYRDASAYYDAVAIWRKWDRDGRHGPPPSRPNPRRKSRKGFLD